MRASKPTTCNIRESAYELKQILLLEDCEQRRQLLYFLIGLSSGETFEDALANTTLKQGEAVKCCVNYNTSGLCRALNYNSHRGSKLTLTQQMLFARQVRSGNLTSYEAAQQWFSETLQVTLSPRSIRTLLLRLDLKIG